MHGDSQIYIGNVAWIDSALEDGQRYKIDSAGYLEAVGDA
jgi:hypothetical protein